MSRGKSKGRAGKKRRIETRAFYVEAMKSDQWGTGGANYHRDYTGATGQGAALRRLRQAARIELKQLRKQHGITSPMFQGMGPGGALLLEVPAEGERHIEASVLDEGLVVLTDDRKGES